MVAPTTSPLSIRDRPSSRFQLIVDGVLSLLYPDACYICSVPIARLQDCGVCDTCWKRTLDLRILRPFCPSCGLPLPQPGLEGEYLCITCSSKTPIYSGARSFGVYVSELSLLVQGLKFHGRRNLVHLLSPLLAAAFHESWDRSEFDCVVPIPLHPQRKRERGFNQAALLAHSLAGLIGIPCCEPALSRTRRTQPQVGLSDPERFRNLKNAFACGSSSLVAQKRVLLVDDVMTTGATAASASEALLAAGALRVSALTVARTIPGL
jgi:ComF family protein